MQRIRWIVFDAVGTLIFADPPVHRVYHEVGRRHGSSLDLEEIGRRFDRAFSQQSRAQAGAADERRFWRTVVGEVLGDVNDIEACFEELFSHFARPEAWRCFADVEPMLTSLRSRGFRLAIASNFDARLHRICDGLPELRHIERRVISSEVGCSKPDSAFYRALSAACDCTADEMLIIGDHLENDVLAPRSLGVAAWHLRRGSQAGDGSLRSLAELTGRLPPGAAQTNGE